MSKRSLILAGGGLKVGYQAGVLQVWLDEAGLTFDHADGASGGTLNLAMYCQGMTGTQIADNWRTLDPFLPIDINTAGIWPMSSSLFTYDNFRARVLPFWKIDWTKINRTTKNATFNVFNFSKKQLEVVPPSAMTEDHLIAGVSLPMWFPPVTINGDTYFDAVYISDANLEEAVRQGADEIWAIWTVSRRNEWRDGFIAQYFQIIETVADTNFFTYWKRLEKNNAEIAAGRQGEFGRHIELRLIEAEVPVHYILNASRDRMAEAVNAGVEDARKWCRDNGIPLTAGAPVAPAPAAPATSLQFSEEMKGFLAAGVTSATTEEYEAAEAKGKANKTPFMFHLTVDIADVDHFVTSPQHSTVANGFVDSPLVGGKCPVNGGTVQLFVDAGDPTKKNMRYRLKFTGKDNKPYTLVGFKNIDGKTFAELWPETTTLYSTLHQGHVDEGAVAPVVASGVTHIRPEDFFFMQMFSFRVKGPSLAARTQAMARFGAFFFGKVWDVYGHQIGPF